MNATICADDEVHMLSFYEAILEPKGYAVRCVLSGSEAIEAHRRDKADLLILDIDMPGKSGIDVCRELRARGDSVPIVLISAHDSEAKIREGLSAGADDYIVKPCKAGELLAKAGAILAHHRCGFRHHDPVIPGFRLIEELGEGAMGIVYIAAKADGGSDRKFAVKVCKSGQKNKGDEKCESYKRFLREAEAASRVNHPNVVRIEDFGMCPGSNMPYIVMEYIDGRLLTDINSDSGALTLDQRCRVIRQVAAALTAIHGQKICHRDIKPQNIIVDADLHVNVMDFGIARLPDRLTSITTHLIGTPNYIAPEAFLSSDVDHRADIFSLGVVAYEHFLGRLPFVAGSIPVLANMVQHERPTAPRDIDPEFPPALEMIIGRMLEKLPADRYACAADIVADFDRFIAGNAGDQRPPQVVANRVWA